MVQNRYVIIRFSTGCGSVYIPSHVAVEISGPLTRHQLMYIKCIIHWLAGRLSARGNVGACFYIRGFSDPDWAVKRQLAGCVLSAANTPNESAESTIAAVAVLIFFIILFSYLFNAICLRQVFRLCRKCRSGSQSCLVKLFINSCQINWISPGQLIMEKLWRWNQTHYFKTPFNINKHSFRK